MKRLLLVVLLTQVFSSLASAQPTGSKTPEFRLPITYQDQQLTQHIAFGYDPAATTGQDTVFGEEVYPNFGGPGSGVAYLDYPGVIDYGTRVNIMPKPSQDSFYIQYFAHFYGSVYPGKVSWDPALIPSGVTGITIAPLGNPSKILVDMKQASSADIVTTDFEYHDWENAVITLFYNMTPRVLGVHDGPRYAGLISNLSAYPNPFSAESKLSFDVADASVIELQAFDLTGREVGHASLTAAGHLDFPLSQLLSASGMYLVRLNAAGSSGSDEKTLLVRRK